MFKSDLGSITYQCNRLQLPTGFMITDYIYDYTNFQCNQLQLQLLLHCNHDYIMITCDYILLYELMTYRSPYQKENKR